MPKISIVMPVYSVEEFISSSINSVLQQTFVDWELIIVNDNSPDNCRQIIETHFLYDTRIKLINKSLNEGLSKARNTGLSHIKGEYIMFMDSDDWLEKDMLEQLYKNAVNTQADIIVCGYYQDFYKKSGELYTRVTVIPQQHLAVNCQNIISIIPILDKEKVFCYAWNKLYRADFLKQNGLLFQDIPMIEDFVFNINLLPKAQVISILPTALYHYRKANSNALSSKYLDNLYSLVKMRYTLMESILIENNLSTMDLRGIICSMYIKEVFSVLEKDCYGKKGWYERYSHAKLIATDPISEKARKNCIASSYQMFLLNNMFKLKYPIVYLLYGRLIYILKKYLSGVFNRIK